MKCSDKFITENKNEISKFVFLFDTPALQTDISKYCLRTLKRLGREAVVVDLSPFVNSDVNCCVTAERMSSEVFPVQRIYTKEEFKNFISKHVKGYFYFPLFDDYYGVRLVYRLFSKYKIPYAYINNLNPDVGDAGIPKIIFGSGKYNWKHFRAAIYNRILRKVFPGAYARVYFYANLQSKEHYFWRGNCKEGKTKQIGVHSFDLDRYLASTAYANEDYAVFLDVFMPYHPDLLGLDLNVNAQKYFSNMNAVFDKIEEMLDIKVYIAAHPRANYRDKEYSFRENRIIYGKTAELVKGAKFLLGSYSTTNQMAVMSNKKLWIVCDSEVEKLKFYGKRCIEQAEFFGTEIIKIPDDIKHLNFAFNENLYNEIRRQYFAVDGTQTPDLWNRILEGIEGIIIEEG